MGVGKTYHGKRWAAAHDLPFLDLDAYIEEKEAMSITEIFEQKGEAYFREVESRFLRQIEDKNLILACGGGTPCHKNNMDFMLTAGTTIWLDASAEYIVYRLQNGIAKRPMLRTGEKDNYTHINKLLAERQSCYAKANYHIQVTEDIDQIVQQIFLNNA